MSNIKNDLSHPTDDDKIKLKGMFAAYKEKMKKKVTYEEWQQRIGNNI